MKLDVGCGGSGDEEFKQNIEKGVVTSPLHGDVGIDIRKPKVKRENFVRASAEAIPFRDKVFEKAFSFDVIEHVNGACYMVREMKRVAKEILIITPNSVYLPVTLMSMISKEQKHKPYADHVVTWSKAEMEGMLNRVGFKSYSVRFTNIRAHKPRWFVRLILVFCPFPALKNRALCVRAEK